MSSDNNNKLSRNLENEFNGLIKSMNEFIGENPFKRIFESLDDLLSQPLFIQQIPIRTFETDTEYVINAELPGVKREQINLEFFEHYVTISLNNSEIIEESNDKQQTYQKMHTFQQASRTIHVPYKIPEQNVTATFRNGLLDIRIPRQQRKRISIQE
ncbi:Hsp20/alpha crystallin family protein [Cytobacillus sp. Hm23]